MAEKIDLVEIDLSAIIKQIDVLTDNITELETANKRLRIEMNKETGETMESLKARKKLNRQIHANNESLKGLKKEKSDSIKLSKIEIGSIEALRASNAKLTKERNRLNVSTIEGQKRLREINNALDKNNEAIKNNTDNLTQQKINVGNYSSALDGLDGKLKNSTTNIGSIGDAAENAGGGIGDMIGGFKAFLANPYVAIFAAIAGAIIAIGGAFKSSRAGGVLLQKGMANISATTDIAKKRFNEYTNDILESETPLATVFTKQAESIARALPDFIKKHLNMQKVAEGATDTFLEEASSLALLKKELIDLNDSFIDVENELLKEIITLQGLGDIQGAIADDSTRSLNEQRLAAEKAANLSEQAGKAQVSLANKRLEIAEAEIEVGIKAGALMREQDGNIKSLTADGIELEKTFTEAQITAIEASNNLTTTRIQNAQRIATIKQDDFEQELDFLIDIADSQKTVNEQQIADDRIALAERKKILEQTNKIVEDSFDSQLRLFEKDRGVQLDRQAIAKLNNDEIVNYAKGLGMSEIATNRLKEVIVERRKAVQDLAMAERDLEEEGNQRRALALESIREFEQAKLLSIAVSAEEEKALRIQFETDEYNRLLENKLLLDEELEALEIEHKATLDKIDEDYNKKIIDRDKKTADEKKKNFNQGTNIIQQGTSTLFSAISESERQNLELSLQAVEGNEEKQQELRREYAERGKKTSRANAIIGAALAIVQSFAQLGPIAGAIAAIGVATTTALQIRAINNQKFANGGEVKAWQATGASHAQGGIPLHIGGKYAGEIEGNEGVYVVNKHDNPAAIASLSATNSVHGKPFAPRSYMQDGGEATQQQIGISFEQALELQRSAPIFVAVTDINDGQSTNVKVVANGEI